MTPDQPSDEALNAPELQALLVECLEKLERGETLDPDQLFEANPEHADALSAFLADQQMLRRVAGEVRDSSSGKPLSGQFDNRLEETIDSNPKTVTLATGQRIRYIGEYEIIDEIARGGMGVVFKARQQKLGRIVALKMILSGTLADDADVERFHREARAAGRLKHPNIVPIHEIGKHEGHHYFTMDFVDGHSLSDAIRDETLSPRRAAELIKTVAEAVEFAHQQGTLHRDLKPANILLDSENEPHVTDFGLAKDLGDDEELTASGQILGTPSYMSPEQAAGKHSHVGPASDIYALGAVLYACLTGRAPFVADSPVDTLMQVIRKEPVSPRQLNPAIPRDLETICLKCLRKEPHHRYGTAQELADDLRRFIEGRPVAARPIGRIGRSWRWTKRNPVFAGMVALIAATLIAGTAVSSYFAIEASYRAEQELAAKNKQAELRIEAVERKNEAITALTNAEKSRADMLREMQRADEKARVADEERVIADSQLKTARWLEYGSKISAAQGYWDAGEPRLALMNLNATASHRRGWEYGHLKHRFTQGHEVLQTDVRNPSILRYDASGTRLARFDHRNSSATDDLISVWNTETLDRICRIEVAGLGVRSLAISADGKRIAVGGYAERNHNDTFRVWNIDSGELLLAGTARFGTVHQLAFRENGEQLVTFTRNQKEEEVATWDVAGGNRLSTIETDELRRRRILVTERGKVYAIAQEEDTIEVHNVLNSKVIGTFPCWDRPIDRMAISPDDSVLALLHVGELATVVRLNLIDEANSTRFAIELDYRPSCAISADNRYLITHSSASSTNVPAPIGASKGLGAIVHVWDIATGKLVAKHQGHSDYVLSLAVHPERELFVTGSMDNTIRRWPIVPHVEQSMRATEHIKTIRFSPDGERLAVSGDELQIWDLKTREILVRVPKNYVPRDIAFNHDGTQFALTASEYVDVYRADNGERLWRSPKLRGGSTSVQFSPDSKRLYCGTTADELHIYDTESHKLLAKMKDPRDRSVAPTTINSISIDFDRHLGAAAQATGSFLIWNLETHELEHRRHENEYRVEANRIAFGPQGKLLAMVTNGSKVPNGRIWNTVDWSEVCELNGHRGKTMDVAFHPDGNRVATASWDRTVKIWDVEKGQTLLTLGGSYRLSAVAFSPDGRRLAAGGFAGEVYVWDSLPIEAENDIQEATELPPDEDIRPAEPRVFSIDLRSDADGELREIRFEQSPLKLHANRLLTLNALQQELSSAVEELADDRPVGLRIWADPHLKYGNLSDVIEQCHDHVTCLTPFVKAGLSPERVPFQGSEHMYDSLIVTIGGDVDDQYCILRLNGNFHKRFTFAAGHPFREPSWVRVSLTPNETIRVSADRVDLGAYPESVTKLNALAKDYHDRWMGGLRNESQWIRNGTRLRIDRDVPVEVALNVYRALRLFWQESDDQKRWLYVGQDIVLPMFEADGWPPIPQ